METFIKSLSTDQLLIIKKIIDNELDVKKRYEDILIKNEEMQKLIVDYYAGEIDANEIIDKMRKLTGVEAFGGMWSTVWMNRMRSIYHF